MNKSKSTPFGEEEAEAYAKFKGLLERLNEMEALYEREDDMEIFPFASSELRRELNQAKNDWINTLKKS